MSLSEEIKLLDGKAWDKDELLNRMVDDSFYYGYLSKAALSSSASKDLLKSSKSYYKSLSRKQKETQALREGRLFHTLVLEPETIQHKYELVSNERRDASVRKIQSLADREVILQKEYNFMKALMNNVVDCVDAFDLIQGGLAEVPAIGMINDIPFRGKADYLKSDHIVDLKTTVSLDGWLWTAKNKWHYDMQAYIYKELFNVSRFTFLVVEKISGEIAIFETTAESFESGRQKVQTVTDRYKRSFLNKNESEIRSEVYNQYQTGEF
jgi:hypothetical protein